MGSSEIGTSLFSLVRDARRATREGMAGVLRRRDARLASLVAFAREHSRFYAQHYASVPRDGLGLRQLPVTTKPALMDRFDDWVTDPGITRLEVERFVSDPDRVGGRFLGRYTVWTTSGSTGTPAVLIQDEHAIRVMAAMGWARARPAWIGLKEIQGFARRGLRGAMIFATGGHFMALSMACRASEASGWLGSFGSVISALLPTDELVRRLNALGPTLVASYASGLVLLAREQSAGRLRIDPLLLISTGETLSPRSRAQVEASFGPRVRETYGASEIQVAAFECREGKLHLNADWVILEPVDKDYRPVPVGEPSHTVLATSLANFVQPVIRYDLGDSLTVGSGGCACGNPLPTIKVEGRSSEILSFTSPSGVESSVLPSALITCLEDVKGLHRFQLVQDGTDSLMVRIEPERGAEEDDIWRAASSALRLLLDRHGLDYVAVKRSRGPVSPASPSGKIRQILINRQAAGPASRSGD